MSSKSMSSNFPSYSFLSRITVEFPQSAGWVTVLLSSLSALAASQRCLGRLHLDGPTLLNMLLTWDLSFSTVCKSSLRAVSVANDGVRALNETVFRIAHDVMPSLNINFLIDNNRQIDITILQQLRVCTTFIQLKFRTMIPSDHTSIPTSYVAMTVEVVERPVVAYCWTVLSWAELKWAWSEVNWSQVGVNSKWTEYGESRHCLNTARVDLWDSS